MQTSIYFSLSLHNHDKLDRPVKWKWLRLVISFIAELIRASRATLGDEALFQV